MGAEVLSLDTDGLPKRGDVLEGRWRIDGVIGRGGMGTVFAAIDGVSGRRVAIKTLNPEGETEELIQRLLREAQAATEVRSEHVAAVEHVGRRPNGLPFVVMELLEGETLDALARRERPLGIQRAVDLILDGCEGLAASHAAGVIHRDLKPSNLFVTRRADGSELLKILDFGIAKTAQPLPGDVELPTLTSTGSTLGSPRYMSPEQIRNPRAVDARTDIFSIGVVVHKVLSGRLPFEADTLAAYAAMIAADPPTPVREHRPEIPIALEQAILRCLEKKPERRWPTMTAFAAALEPFASPRGKAIAARLLRDYADAPTVHAGSMSAYAAPEPSADPSTMAAVSSSEPVLRPSPRWRAWATLAGAASIGAIAAVGVFFSRSHEHVDASPHIVVTASEATTAPATIPASTSEAKASLATIRFKIDPPSATIEIDGAAANGPTAQLAPGSHHKVTARANGFDPETRELDVDGDQEIAFELKHAHRSGSQAAPPAVQPAPPPSTSQSAHPRLKPLMEQTL